MTRNGGDIASLQSKIDSEEIDVTQFQSQIDSNDTDISRVDAATTSCC